MGLFSGFKKAVKNVFKGVKKVFKKVSKFVGKIAGSKWGKALLLAAGVVTGGLAIASGIGAFTGQAAGATFMTKFVAGAKGFVGALLNPVAAGKGALAGAQAGGGFLGAAQGAAQGVGALEAGVAMGTEGLANVAQGGSVMKAPTALQIDPVSGGLANPNAATAGLPNVSGWEQAALTANQVPQSSTAGMLSEASKSFGSKALDFAKSTGGGLLLSGALQGYAQGKVQEDMLKKGDYYDRQWADPRQQMLLEEAARSRPRTPGGFAERSARMELDSNRFQSRYARGGI